MISSWNQEKNNKYGRRGREETEQRADMQQISTKTSYSFDDDVDAIRYELNPSIPFIFD